MNKFKSILKNNLCLKSPCLPLQKMKRELIITEDGSSSIYVKDLNESYHSRFGALNESLHIFIESGLNQLKKDSISILEVGFGTGLNALLTLDEAIKTKQIVKYYCLEKHPLSKEEWASLNYTDITQIENAHLFNQLHELEWDSWHELSDYYNFYKSKQDLLKFETNLKFDLIYFDAFSPDVQAKLWTEEVFQKMYNCMNPGGLFLSYSVKGMVKRALKSVGFNIELIPGPIGKRVIMRAHK